MSYTFRVIFEGVCGYVPEKPFFVPDPWWPFYWFKNWDTVGSLSVLLPDLRRPGNSHLPDNPSLHFPKFRDPHFPILSFGLDDLREGTTRRVDLVCRDISERNEKGLLFLRQEQVRFSMNCENGGVFTFAGWTPSLPRQLGEHKPDLGERKELDSLWWLPSFDRIIDNPEQVPTVKRSVLPSEKGPFPEGLIARIECSGGHLRTFDFNRSVDGNPLIWRFAAPDNLNDPGSWNRAIGNSVALEFYDVRGEVNIEIRRLANDVVVRNLVLAPGPGASRPVLEVVISNREPELLFEEEGFSKSALPDMDFQAFYEFLSDLKPGSDVSKLPIPHPARTSFFGVREKPCAGAVVPMGV